MAVSSGRARTTDLNHKMQIQIPKKWKDRDQTSPERTKVWTEPKHKPKTDRKVSVVYYLSRNGQLEHPHFLEVPLSPSSDGLYLRDVIDRLNFLRGKGMASMYSWSSKRSYKNGFVWHDLGENDFIYPVHGQEYILKGSELIIKDDGPLLTKSNETLTSSSSSSSKKHSESQRFFAEVSDTPVISRRRNQSWSSIDLHEYKVYKTDLTGESSSLKAAADASTQTDDKRRRRRLAIKEEEHDHHQDHQDQRTELSREEISPPPSDSSPETLETLMKADGRLILCPGTTSGEIKSDPHPTAGNSLSGRMKASTVLMQLISCGSMSFRDCGSAYVKDQVGREAENQKEMERERLMIENSGGTGTINTSNSRVTRGVGDKEYFSGSLIETKKDDIPTLQRSSSYNSGGNLQLELAEKEIEGVRAKCIPRKPKTPQAHHTQRESSTNNNDLSVCPTSTPKQST